LVEWDSWRTRSGSGGTAKKSRLRGVEPCCSISGGQKDLKYGGMKLGVAEDTLTLEEGAEASGMDLSAKGG